MSVDTKAAVARLMRFLAIEGITPLQGGLPVMADGKLIGAVGVSGVMSSQDEQVAQAALNVLSNS